MTAGVYIIICKSNNRYYVGSSVNIETRFKIHKTHLNTKKHANKHLQRSWNKYGKENFHFEIICECGKTDTLIFEQQALDFIFDSLNRKEIFNISQHAQAPWKGTTLSKSTRLKISKSLSGRPGRVHSAEVLSRMRLKKCKIYTGFVTPSGELHPPIHDLKNFCKENNLSYYHMNKVINGKYKSHRKWTKFKGDILP